jgi:hypothetical protein
MGIEIELLVLLMVQLLGTQIFGKFEIETPAWRKIVKWAFIAALTLGLYPAIGHWSLIAPFSLVAAGLIFHFIWCRKHGIHPINATPRKRYYELRGWTWPE